MQSYLLKGGIIINEGQRIEKEILIEDGRIVKIETSINAPSAQEINVEGKYILPGIVDDQVHFRDPGLTHKGDLYSEPKAAVAGGVTSFMEMPNTKPPAVTQEKLAEKYERASQVSLANYSFFMGATNDNLEEVLKTDRKEVCGVKIFMGSSTGNMLVDNETALDKLFAEVPILIATHCEDEQTIRKNLQTAKEQYGDDIPIAAHPIIRNVEGCLLSSQMAIDLAKKHDTRLHILHISTADELALFRNDIPLTEKRITSEVCVHHLHFSADEYATLGTQIKCNPAVKAKHHRVALFEALLDNRLDIIATDHAPHTWEEKSNPYLSAPSGVPLVQHSLNIMLEFEAEGKITLERIVEKMCHAPTECFQLKERGFIREGYWADLIILDREKEWEVTKDNILYHCGWSPLEGKRLKGKVETTFVSGHKVYDKGVFDESRKGIRLQFNR